MRALVEVECNTYGRLGEVRPCLSPVGMARERNMLCEGVSLVLVAVKLGTITGWIFLLCSCLLHRCCCVVWRGLRYVATWKCPLIVFQCLLVCFVVGRFCAKLFTCVVFPGRSAPATTSGGVCRTSVFQSLLYMYNWYSQLHVLLCCSLFPTGCANQLQRCLSVIWNFLDFVCKDRECCRFYFDAMMPPSIDSTAHMYDV